jgi:hypothetical protein
LLEIYFINSLPTADVTKDGDGVITAVANDPTAYKYELRADAEFTDSIKTDKQTGSTFYEATVSCVLHSLDPSTHKELKLLAYGSPLIAVKTNSGKLLLMGEIRGCDMTVGDIKIGKAMGDMQGYELTFMSSEKSYAPFFDDELAAVGFTVVAGA